MIKSVVRKSRRRRLHPDLGCDPACRESTFLWCKSCQEQLSSNRSLLLKTAGRRRFFRFAEPPQRHHAHVPGFAQGRCRDAAALAVPPSCDKGDHRGRPTVLRDTGLRGVSLVPRSRQRNGSRAERELGSRSDEREARCASSQARAVLFPVRHRGSRRSADLLQPTLFLWEQHRRPFCVSYSLLICALRLGQGVMLTMYFLR